jgi:hypothetical protein
MESGAEPPVARQLRCELAVLADAFDDASWEMSVYPTLTRAMQSTLRQTFAKSWRPSTGSCPRSQPRGGVEGGLT